MLCFSCSARFSECGSAHCDLLKGAATSVLTLRPQLSRRPTPNVLKVHHQIRLSVNLRQNEPFFSFFDSYFCDEAPLESENEVPIKEMGTS